MRSLAFSLFKQEKHLEAETVYRTCFERSEKTLGPLHMKTLEVIGWFVQVLKALHHYREAETMARIALERYRQVFGEHHQYTLWVADELENILRMQRNSSEGMLTNLSKFMRDFWKGMVLGCEILLLGSTAAFVMGWWAEMPRYSLASLPPGLEISIVDHPSSQELALIISESFDTSGSEGENGEG
jgi:Tetratricopeptide repeat